MLMLLRAMAHSVKQVARRAGGKVHSHMFYFATGRCCGRGEGHFQG